MKKTINFPRNFRGPKTALVIGDDGKIRELISIILEEFGSVSIQASSATFLREKENLDEPGLIVWDLEIGENMKAFLEFSDLRVHGLMKEAKTLLLAGTEIKADVRSSVDDSMICLCSKPFTPRTFRFEIAKLFKEKNDE